MATKHGHKKPNAVHPLYYRWQQMKSRCYNPNNRTWRFYGKRGIKVCRRWHKFPAFLADMGPTFKPGLTLERKNGNKGYNPRNVIWATWEHQWKTKRQRGPASKYL